MADAASVSDPTPRDPSASTTSPSSNDPAGRRGSASRGRGRGKMRGGRSDRRAPEPGNGGCEDDLDANREAEDNNNDGPDAADAKERDSSKQKRKEFKKDKTNKSSNVPYPKGGPVTGRPISQGAPSHTLHGPPLLQQPYSNAVNGNARVYEVGPKRLRILCVTHIQGRLSHLCQLIESVQPMCVINAGNFGFFDEASYDDMKAREMRARLQSSHVYSLTEEEKNKISSMNDNDLRQFLMSKLLWSELPLFIEKKKHFPVPIYTIWGQQEDVRVLEKFRKQEYKVENLFLIDERHSFKIPQTDIRLLGLGGNVVYHWLFDNGLGEDTIAGDVGKMWTTLQQVAELKHTAERTYDGRETRVFVSFVSPGREPLVAQIAHMAKADYSISGHLHSRYCVSYNDWAVQKVTGDENSYEQRLAATRAEISRYWAEVKDHIEGWCTPEEKTNFETALKILDTPPSEEAYRTLWSISLADMDVGHACLSVQGSKVGIETYSEGRDFSTRKRNERRQRPLGKEAQKDTAPSKSGKPRLGKGEAGESDNICKYFKAGHCRNRDNCQFTHAQA